jgi:WD40 repeat protein
MWAIAISPHTEILATAGTGQTINFWDIHTRERVTSLEGHTHRIRAITFNKNGKLIASSSDDFSIRLWNVETQQCLQLFCGHTGEIRALTFIPPSNDAPEILVSASDDYTIRLWDTRTGCFEVLTGHQGRIWSVCYSPQLNILFSCGEDETIQLWDIRALKCIKTLRISKPYEGMNINGVSGLNSATLETLRVLGAVSVETSV